MINTWKELEIWVNKKFNKMEHPIFKHGIHYISTERYRFPGGLSIKIRSAKPQHCNRIDIIYNKKDGYIISMEDKELPITGGYMESLYFDRTFHERCVQRCTILSKDDLDFIDNLKMHQFEVDNYDNIIGFIELIKGLNGFHDIKTYEEYVKLKSIAGGM